MATQLTAHFTLEDLCRSQVASRRGLDNTPGPAIVANLRTSALHMEIVRQLLGNKPILVDSGYRSAAVNAAVGGDPHSAHMLGYAVDFVCPDFGTPYQVAKFLADKLDDLHADKLIYEFRDWVHISFAPAERRECLTIFSGSHGYLPGIVEEAP